jgi:hypothetical protein
MVFFIFEQHIVYLSCDDKLHIVHFLDCTTGMKCEQSKISTCSNYHERYPVLWTRCTFVLPSGIRSLRWQIVYVCNYSEFSVHMLQAWPINNDRFYLIESRRRPARSGRILLQCWFVIFMESWPRSVGLCEPDPQRSTSRRPIDSTCYRLTLYMRTFKSDSSWLPT